MHMAIESGPWTRADLDRLPEDGNKYEVINGVLFVTPPPAVPHQNLISLLNGLITPFVIANGIGVVHQARSVMVAGDSQVEPDLMVLPHMQFTKWDEAPVPLLVVEVLSQSTRRRDLGVKRHFYIGQDVPEYWIVDRFTRSILRIRPGVEETITASLSWKPDGTEASLGIDVAHLFTMVPS